MHRCPPFGALARANWFLTAFFELPRASLFGVTYPDERARPILERTLGVVLFQEQILRLAMELGRFTASEADELRRAIGFTRSTEHLERMKAKPRVALLRNAVTAEAAESIITSLASFALYGFPESPAISFALTTGPCWRRQTARSAADPHAASARLGSTAG